MNKSNVFWILVASGLFLLQTNGISAVKEPIAQPAPDGDTLPGPLNQSQNPARDRVGEGDKKPAGPVQIPFGKDAGEKPRTNIIARIGRVEGLAPKKIRLIDGQGRISEFRLSTQTVVMNGKRRGTLADVKEGQAVTLQYDEDTLDAEQINLRRK